MAARVKKLKREVRELRQTNEILKKASRISPSRGQKAGGSSPKVPRSGDLGGARPPVAEVSAFMDDHRGEHRLEPMCRVLSIVPSTWHAHAAARANPDLRSKWAQEDERLSAAILHADNFGVYGLAAVEIARMDWVDWYNTRRLLGSIGDIPSAEAEAATTPPLRPRRWRHRTQNKPASGKPRSVHSVAIVISARTTSATRISNSVKPHSPSGADRPSPKRGRSRRSPPSGRGRRAARAG
jgi:hypothetical protein